MKKVFFVISSLSSGGSERVFWLISQNFDRSKYEIYLVILDSTRSFYSTDLEGVKIVDLKTIKASKSFFKMYQLLRKEKPYAVYSTLSHINILIAALSFFVKIPRLIARESSIPNQTAKFGKAKGKFYTPLISVFYRKFDAIVCQSEEMRHSLNQFFKISSNKLVVIPNPVLNTPVITQNYTTENHKKAIVIGRLAHEKGHSRLLKVFKELDEQYYLTVTGEGYLRTQIEDEIKQLGLSANIQLTGAVKEIPKLIAAHKILIMSSFTEGFPNVVLESLSVGVPVVAFKVGGISQIIKEGFNGYIVEQGDLQQFKLKIEEACNRSWDAEAIKQDVLSRFAVENIVSQYENLIDG